MKDAPPLSEDPDQGWCDFWGWLEGHSHKPVHGLTNVHLPNGSEGPV